MPKQIWKIERFEGGLNTHSDPRDIADNELADAVDVMVDNIGKVRTVGGTENHAANTSCPTVTIDSGYGLFQFSHDRLGADSAGTTQAETGDDYIALADSDSTAAIRIYSISN